MKSDYWDVTDDQVIEKTGKPLRHWMGVLEKFGTAGRKSGEEPRRWPPCS